ncbi:MAG: hypothetical protein KBS43_03045 [Oscillospiraceae bacterium]|nr:hypothetical protein [Candidatus Limimonas coprohippi]
MEKLNNYPVIMVHGFLCWGTESKINKFFPCFGMWHGNGRESILEAGTPCFTPHVGPFTSMWDRACILYAMIKGGRVDFGKVHSEKMGHDRYGDTFPGYVPNWGELDAAGKIQKINLIGHSFGTPTVRTLIHLLVEGDADEIAGTDPSELSDLFKGGKKNWVHSCTTLAGTHNGVTLPDAGRPLVKPMATALFTIGNLTSGTWFSRFYDFRLEWFGFTSKEEHIPYSVGKEKIKHLVDLDEDNIYYELSTEGAPKLLSKTKAYDNIYYFSYYGRRTRRKAGIEYPSKDIWFPLRIFSPFECLYSDDTHKGELWQANDGIVNMGAAHHPDGQPFVEFADLKNGIADVKPGIWNVMPVEWKDHTSYMGVGETDEGYDEYMKTLVANVCALPTID